MKEKFNTKKRKALYDYAVNRGWIQKINADIRGTTPWTVERILEDARKYSTRAEWKKASKKEYVAAKAAGILSEACKHMIVVKRKWADEELVKHSKKYKTLKEWIKKDESSYRTAKRRNLI